MNLNFQRGDKLVIKLNTQQIYEGEYVRGTKDRVDLINLSEYETGSHLGSSMLSFYVCEICSVHLLNKEKQPDDNALNDTNPDAIVILEDEYERLKTMGQKYIYMPTIDKRYYDAITHLNTCENIGVLGIGQNKRLSSLDLLLFCSWDQIYIFDILLFNQKKMPPEIKSILESHEIRKIVHDSRYLTDCLHYCHQINLSCVFDTQMADASIYKNIHGHFPDELKTIGQCLSEYFNFPTNFLDNAMNVKVQKWSERPISTGTRNLAAQLCTYLFILKNHLEHLLLQDFYNVVNIYSKSTIDCSPCEANMQFNSSKLCDSLLSISLTDSCSSPANNSSLTADSSKSSNL